MLLLLAKDTLMCNQLLCRGVQSSPLCLAVAQWLVGLPITRRSAIRFPLSLLKIDWWTDRLIDSWQSTSLPWPRCPWQVFDNPNGHVTALFTQSHWLSMSGYPKKFKSQMLVYRVSEGSAPTYPNLVREAYAPSMFLSGVVWYCHPYAQGCLNLDCSLLWCFFLISVRLTECIPVCSLKVPSASCYLLLTVIFITMLPGSEWVYRQR